jgi:hypothetical protein
MGRRLKTLFLLKEALNILDEHHPMTVRQVYYQLVSRQVVKNTRRQYQAISTILVEARKDGIIPWEWIEDRLRRPRAVSMWYDLADFAYTASKTYRRNVWATQERLVEVWLEKDALSGIFEDVLRPYGVTLNVGHGYDGWDSIHNAAERYLNWNGEVVILYFGDFDPSGEDMLRSLGERLRFFGTNPNILKCALTLEDVETYRLPPDFTKTSDTRRASFVAKYGDIAVELDALPVNVLQERLRHEVERHMNLDALAKVWTQEAEDRQRIAQVIGAFEPPDTPFVEVNH